MSERPRISDRFWRKAALGLLFAIIASGGIYPLLLAGKQYRLMRVDAATGRNVFEIEPSYRLEGRVVAAACRPFHEVDRMIRRDYWMTIEKPSGQAWRNPVPRD